MLLSIDNISLAFGLEPLLDHAKLQISKGERICLIGRNGAGKSSLLKIIAGTLLPDAGSIWRAPHLRLANLEQDLPLNSTLSVYEFVAEGMAEMGELLMQYNALTLRIAKTHTEKDLALLEKLQHAIDAKSGWQYEQHIATILTRLELDPNQLLNTLSGGWLRRAALAKALVASPDLLLLDEPTNHLDIEAIQWLEDELLSSGITLLFITHDRALLQKLATRIIELDRGKLTSWPGNYKQYLIHKDELLHAEEKQNADFDKKLAQEEIWIRQGIKARRTRNEGRVRALESMREVVRKRRQLVGKASFSLQGAEKSGDLIIEASHVHHSFQQKKLIADFSTRIMRGDKIGLIGPNGVGKSTLLNILLGNLHPDAGQVTLGTKLKIAYFDQARQTIDPEKTVVENVIEGSETIERGEHKQHIISYLSDFLFTPKRALTPAKALSGGEKARLLLARLFTKAANLIVMDEPTNDLDIETLDLLQELLTNYTGTLLLVSHDRHFLDNVVTSTLVFEGQGKIQEYVGGYADWLHQRKVSQDNSTQTIKAKKINAEPTKLVKKLSYKDQRELLELPNKIEQLEIEKNKLHQQIAEASFYQQDKTKILEVMETLENVESSLAKSYQRWEELENLAKP